MQTEFDDVLYIVSTIEIRGAHCLWKVSRVSNSIEPIFNIDYKDSDGVFKRTTYNMSTMKYVFEATHVYHMIRSEKEFLVWILKNGDKVL